MGGFVALIITIIVVALFIAAAIGSTLLSSTFYFLHFSSSLLSSLFLSPHRFLLLTVPRHPRFLYSSGIVGTETA